MPNQNQILIIEDDEIFECRLCHRSFGSHPSLLQHCRSQAHQSEWCERCEWLFVSQQALNAHQSDSLRHWMCKICHRDFDEEDDLDTHCVAKHSFCYRCQTNFPNHRKHLVEYHDCCSKCLREFNNSNELDMHLQTHMPRDHECYGCNRKFATDSAIMIHLESNTCDCGVDRDSIDTWAFECYQHRHYTNGWYSDYRYKCPTCDVNFEYVSGLLQHIDSPSCDQDYDGSIRRLKNYIVKKISEWSSDSS